MYEYECMMRRRSKRVAVAAAQEDGHVSESHPDRTCSSSAGGAAEASGLCGFTAPSLNAVLASQ